MKRATAIGTVHQYQYGTSEVVGFDAPWRREVYRPFQVHPKEPWNAAVRERCMATGPSDATPRYRGRYHSDCSCCYLNITHSEAQHARSVKE